MRDWLNLGRPTIPGRRIILEPTTPHADTLRCLVCRKVLIAHVASYHLPGEYRAMKTLDTCSFRCALVLVQLEAIDAEQAAQGP